MRSWMKGAGDRKMKVGPLSKSKKRHSRVRWAHNALSRNNGLASPLTTQLRTWQSFVTQVEKGYALSIHDYTNRLSTRDHLQAGINASSTPSLLRRVFLPSLNRFDNRFKNVTRMVAEPLLPPLDNEKLEWWWYAVPNKLSEDLSPQEVKTWEPYFTWSGSLPESLTV